LYYHTNKTDETVHLGDLELSFVGAFSRYWDYFTVGTIFESRSFHSDDYLDNLQYSAAISVVITTQYNLPEETGSCVLASTIITLNLFP
jgi:hypothetical protein